MGLFGRRSKAMREMIENAQKQYGYDAASAGSPLGQAWNALGQAGEGQRLARLYSHGSETPGTLLATRPTGNATPQGAEHEIRLSVQPPGAPAYEVTITQWLHPSSVMNPGDPLTLKVDPEDPSSLIVWGGPPADPAASATPGPEPLDALDALDALGRSRERGLISDAEFETRKARLLADM